MKFMYYKMRKPVAKQNFKQNCRLWYFMTKLSHKYPLPPQTSPNAICTTDLSNNLFTYLHKINILHNKMLFLKNKLIICAWPY